MRSKWGTDEDDHKKGYSSPYNDKRLHTSFWIVNQAQREKIKIQWEACYLRQNVR